MVQNEEAIRPLEVRSETIGLEMSIKSNFTHQILRGTKPKLFAANSSRASLPIVAGLRWIGSKRRSLPQILPYFPTFGVNTFIDLFCGGGSVGANVHCANKVVFIDSDRHIIGLLKFLYETDIGEAIRAIKGIGAKYGLSDHKNSEGYYRLRSDYNSGAYPVGMKDAYYFALLACSFSCLSRFNSKGDFNAAYGSVGYGPKQEGNIRAFLEALKSRPCKFFCGDFRSFDFTSLGLSDFVYADPPFLGTGAEYCKTWSKNDFLDLLKILDGLTGGGRFIMSEVLENKGSANSFLLEELGKRPAWKVHKIKADYSNCFYCRQDKRRGGTNEVLITNF